MTIPKIAAYEMPAPASWPPCRVNWPLSPHRAALLIHDMQDYFVDFYERAHGPMDTLLRNVERVRTLCKSRSVPVFYTAQPAAVTTEARGLLTAMWGPGLPARPEREGIVAVLRPEPEDAIVEKHRYSGFFHTSLLQQLQAAGRDQLWICGVYAHIGCLTTALDAFMNDIQPVLIADGVADFGREQHAMALQQVASCCGSLVSTAALCDALSSQGADAAWLPIIRQELSNLLQLDPSVLDDNPNLSDLGLDSLRRMELGERFDARGWTVDPAGLMEAERVEDLLLGIADFASQAPTLDASGGGL